MTKQQEVLRTKKKTKPILIWVSLICLVLLLILSLLPYLLLEHFYLLLQNLSYYYELKKEYMQQLHKNVRCHAHFDDHTHFSGSYYVLYIIGDTTASSCSVVVSKRCLALPISELGSDYYNE